MGNWGHVMVGGVFAGAVLTAICEYVRKCVHGGVKEDSGTLLENQLVCGELSMSLLAGWFKEEADKCRNNATGILLRPKEEFLQLLGIADGEMLDEEHYLLQLMYDHEGKGTINEIIPERIVSMRFVNFNAMKESLQSKFGNKMMIVVKC